MHPSEAGRNEVKLISSTMGILEMVRQRASNKDMAGLKTNIQDIKSAQQFVEKQLPSLPTEAGKNKEGFYSPAHAMENALFYATQLIEKGDPTAVGSIAAATDQAQRLGRFGMQAKRLTSDRGNFRGDIERTNLVDIPQDWKESKEGKQFLDLMNKFSDRRVQEKQIDAEDVNLLNELQKLISKAYDGKKLNGDLNTYPIARELIGINLALLQSTVKKSMSQKMAITHRDISTFRLIRGLYHHDTQIEQEQKRDNPVYRDKGPVIIDQPHTLLTSG